MVHIKISLYCLKQSIANALQLALDPTRTVKFGSNNAVPKSERINTKEAPVGWSNDEQLISDSRDPEWREPLGENYGLPRFMMTFHLVSQSRDTLTFLFSMENRFYIWTPEQDSLEYVTTQYNLFGMYRALDRSEEMEVTRLPHRVSRELSRPTKQDILPCRPENKPAGWIDDPTELVEEHSYFSVTSWDITSRRPILSYTSEAGDNDMQFLFAHGRYYLYWQMCGYLKEILHPDISDERNWKVLEEVPQFQSFNLAKVSVREIEGGRRLIKQSDIPPGWEQPREMIDSSKFFHNNVLFPTPLIRSTFCPGDLQIQLVEDNDVFRVWQESTKDDTPTILEGKGGMPDVLDYLRHQHLAVVGEDDEV